MKTFKDGELKPKMVARLTSLTSYCDSVIMGRFVGTIVTIFKTRFCDECKTTHYYIDDGRKNYYNGDLNLENFVKANYKNE